MKTGLATLEVGCESDNKGFEQ